MIQSIENLTCIEGIVRACRPHPTLPDYDVVTLGVEHAEDVAGKANLLAHATGRDVDVSVRRALLASGGPGARLRCRVKHTPDGAMCEPHPAPGDFLVNGR